MNEYLLILIILLSCIFIVIVLFFAAEFFVDTAKNIRRIADALENIVKSKGNK